MRGSDLHRPYRGSRVAVVPESIDVLARAFQVRSPANTYFCAITAAVLYRVPLPLTLEESRILHVGVPAPARAPRVTEVVGHKFQLRDSDIQDLNGLRVTTPARTWCDLATILSVPDLVAAGDYIIHFNSPLATQDELSEAMQRHPGRRGRRRLLRAIGQLNNRSESRMESLLRVLIMNGGITGVTANDWIRTASGYRYRGDLVIWGRKLVIEYQSRFHDGAKAFEADMTRISRLESDGWRVVQVNSRDLDHPAELLERIRKFIAVRPEVA